MLWRTRLWAYEHQSSETFTWKTGSNCSKPPTASDRPVMMPSFSTFKYRPYPDFSAMCRSFIAKAVNISSGSGPSPWFVWKQNKRILKSKLFFIVGCWNNIPLWLTFIMRWAKSEHPIIQTFDICLLAKLNGNRSDDIFKFCCSPPTTMLLCIFIYNQSLFFTFILPIFVLMLAFLSSLPNEKKKKGNYFSSTINIDTRMVNS